MNIDFNNETPKYKIKSCLSPHRKSPLPIERKLKILPEVAINANKKKEDFKYSFSYNVGSYTEKPTIEDSENYPNIHEIQAFAISVIQENMKNYILKHSRAFKKIYNRDPFTPIKKEENEIEKI